MAETTRHPRFAVLGAGSWGTALAMHLTRMGAPTTLWARDARAVADMASSRENAEYLPGIRFPDHLSLSDDLAAAVQDAEVLLIACPSHAFADLLGRVGPALDPSTRIAWATKGFEPGSGRFLHQVVADVLGTNAEGAVVTGPSFAREVAHGLPTALTVASRDESLAGTVAGALHGGTFRAYTSTDIVGAELGGAAKNVYAIATGIADGMELGTNARAALITRGLHEMMRLGSALGASPDTLTGLAGLGDLVLTCTGDLSRNRRLGLALGAGKDLDAALAEIRQVVEGIQAAQEVVRLAAQHDTEVPIAEVVRRIVTDGLTPTEGLRTLMARDPKPEKES
jgi:glycerol-3-phosphate dehydrogenase (NAD(P)+)